MQPQFCQRIKTWNCRVRQTHRRTQGRSEFIYKISCLCNVPSLL
jgi:hypothetical protein